MNRFKLTCVALASLALLASCADQQESIIIAGSPDWGGTCAVQVPAQAFLPFGQLDTRFGAEYLLPLEVQNQLAPQSADNANSGTDNSEVQIVGVDIQLSSQQDPAMIDYVVANGGEAFVDFSPSVPTDSLPGGGTRGFVVSAIPAATARLLGEYQVQQFNAGVAELTTQTVVEVGVDVRVTRTGNSIGGIGEVETRHYDFPVRVCYGCLITCGPCELMTDQDGDGVDETLRGICPAGSLPTDPTEPTEFQNFFGVSLDCPTPQDTAIAPAACGQ